MRAILHVGGEVAGGRGGGRSQGYCEEQRDPDQEQVGWCGGPGRGRVWGRWAWVGLAGGQRVHTGRGASPRASPPLSVGSDRAGEGLCWAGAGCSRAPPDPRASWGHRGSEASTHRSSHMAAPGAPPAPLAGVCRWGSVSPGSLALARLGGGRCCARGRRRSSGGAETPPPHGSAVGESPCWREPAGRPPSGPPTLQQSACGDHQNIVTFVHFTLVAMLKWKSQCILGYFFYPYLTKPASAFACKRHYHDTCCRTETPYTTTKPVVELRHPTLPLNLL